MSFGCGGTADYFAEPFSSQELALLAHRCLEIGLPMRVLGGGSNLLVSDEGVSGLVVRLVAPCFLSISLSRGHVRAGAGALLGRVLARACRAGWAGLEPLAGIPGTVGGAVHGNAGGHEGDTAARILEVTVMTPEGDVVNRCCADAGFRYRGSGLESVVLGACFRVTPDDPGEIARRTGVLLRRRATTQPRQRSAGCIFKNPPDDSAGRLLDCAGLKGTRVGGAEVSRRHANFIVTRPGATSADVLQLMRLLRQAVLDRFGIALEPEVVVWSRDQAPCHEPRSESSA